MKRAVPHYAAILESMPLRPPQPPHRLVTFGCHDTRRNLPSHTSLKRGESDFLAKFEKVYLGQELKVTPGRRQMASGREFGLDGFGRADLVFMAWKTSPAAEDFAAIGLQKLNLTAIEAKLKDWRKGLMQASRYRYFSNRALLVMPPETAAIALRFRVTFQNLNVGLWEFDADRELLIRHFTPRCRKALNAKARERAIHIISERLKLR